MQIVQYRYLRKVCRYEPQLGAVIGRLQWCGVLCVNLGPYLDD